MSDPISARTLPSAGLALSSNKDAVNLVYVSVPPGRLPQATTVTISNARTAAIVRATIVDGGFDPVPIPAELGDTLKVLITNGAGKISESVLLVSPGRPPRVVRTNPPKGKTDVPINRTVAIVFSEPVAPSTVDGTTIRLEHSGTAASGSVQMVPGDDMAAEFAPSGALLPSTAYTLTITRAITDLSGEPLDSAVTVAFTTGTSTSSAAIASMSVLPDSTMTEPGESLRYTVLARDVRGGPVSLPPGATWTSSDRTVVTVDSDGTLRALGSGSATVRVVSGQVEARAKVVVGAVPANAYTSVVAGTFHTCALDATGAAFCWGANDYGQLGNGLVEGAPRLAPTRVNIPVPLLSLTAGGQHTCGLTAEGEAWCWGANPDVTGAIGSREGVVNCTPVITGYLVDLTCTPTPVRVSGALRFEQLVGAGLWFHWDDGNGFSSLDAATCGIALDGQLYCWGGTIDGIVSTGILRGGNGFSRVPALKGTDVRFSILAGGSYHACGIAVDGAVYCWGSNISGELGLGSVPCITGLLMTQPCNDIPQRVEGAPVMNSLSAGLGYTCGLTPAGVTWCWGGGRSVNAAKGNHQVPGIVDGWPAFTSLSTGSTASHLCGIDVNGRAKCWGSASYIDLRPGDPVPPPTTVPADIAEAIRFRQIAAGALHGCGISVSGAVYCWGSNDHGQLGHPGPESRTAVRVDLP